MPRFRSLTSAATLIAVASTAHAQQPIDHGVHPVVAPDGRHIVFTSSRDGTHDLYMMNDDGGDIRRLTNSPENEGIAGWSADGKQIVYSVAKHDTVTLYSLPLDGGASSQIGVSHGQGTRITRDGKRVVYGEMPWQTMQLSIANVDGSNPPPKRLTPGTSAFYCSAISPDGKQLATSRSDSGVGLQIWLFATDGSVSRPLTHFTPEQGHAQCPDWSADGHHLAIQADVPDAPSSKTYVGHIWVIDVATGAATKLAEHAASYADELPSWFPDGKRIAFQSNRTGRWEIWVMNADGTGVRQLTR